MLTRLIIFFLLNFGALALGSLFTSKEVKAAWYIGLDKAPWTPPGWVFGFAWTLIMIGFSFYLSYLWPKFEQKKLFITLFVIQWILNVSWNPVFFYYHNVLGGFIIISALTLLITYYLFNFSTILNYKSVYILPYFLWLLIATSLNAYILIKN